MITVTGTWTGIRNLEDASSYHGAQLAWGFVLAAALVLVIALFG